jgi:protein KRI1
MADDRDALVSAFHTADDDDDDFLVAREDARDLLEPEVSEEERYVYDFFSNQYLRQKRERLRRERAKQWESESSNPILGHYWDDEATLDDGEKFLREYILNMGWKTKKDINENQEKTIDGEDDLSVDSDSADEEFLDRVDEFETKYNFRFEEEGGHAIASHARKVDDSVRVKESKRKRERDSKKARKDEENTSKLMELQRLKNLKRQEIKNRLLEIEKVTGNTGLAEESTGESYLESEFDPAYHDQAMTSLLGDDYYENEDSEFVAQDDESEWNNGDAETEHYEEEAQGRDDDENMWYYCDACIRPIQPGNVGYECRDCEEEEVTICHNCRQSGQHPTSHKLKKFRVAENECPPKDWQSVLFQLKKKRTRDIASGKMDELYGMEYEDLIAGDVACRFKYTQVDSDSFGLSTEAILLKKESELNKSVSLRKLHPYRKGHPMRRVRYHDGERRQ